MTSVSGTWVTPEVDDLAATLAGLRNRGEVLNFLRDVCTLGELEALAHRWKVAQLVDEGLPYQEIAARTGASTTTVTRVAYWLRHGEGGYVLALDRRRRSERGTAAEKRKRS